MDAFVTEVGRRIRRQRELLKLSQERLAERSGLHTAFVGLIERGQREPSLRSLRAMANALNLKLVDLLADDGGKDDPLLREVRRTIGTLSPSQQQEVLDLVRRVVRLAGARRR